MHSSDIDVTSGQCLHIKERKEKSLSIRSDWTFSLHERNIVLDSTKKPT